MEVRKMTKLSRLLGGAAVTAVLFFGAASPASAGTNDDDCRNNAEDVVVGQANVCDNDIIDNVNVNVGAGDDDVL